jgi:hypothetical protein
MIEFTVGEHRYRSRKLNARQQFHVARRLGPLFGQLLTLGPALAQATEPRTNGEDTSDTATARAAGDALEAFTLALARVPDADCDYVLDRCMEATQRLQGGNGSGVAWADVWNQRANRLMFDDIDLPAMMQIASEVLRDNLSGFFSMQPPPAGPPSVGVQGSASAP